MFDGSSTWEAFKADIGNFGILTWKFEEPSQEVNFLDMTLSIVGDHYQKKMNLYLYIPPSLGHSSSSIIKCAIFGLMSCYYAQNTHRWDYIHFIKLLFQLLLSRWWQREAILSIFLVAAKHTASHHHTSQPTTTSKRTTLDDTLFVHWQYHPHGTQQQQIRQLFWEHCGKTLQAIGKDRTIVCYSHLRYIGEYFTQTKLQEPAEYSTESIMGEYTEMKLIHLISPNFPLDSRLLCLPALPSGKFLCFIFNVSFSYVLWAFQAKQLTLKGIIYYFSWIHFCFLAIGILMYLLLGSKSQIIESNLPPPLFATACKLSAHLLR